MKSLIKVSVFAVAISVALSISAYSQTVKITPLGSHNGEFCSRDRAMLFEDPDGTRLLFDAGRTIAGPNDSRLGKIDVVLLSGMHGDHMGDKRISKVGNGTCAKPQTEVDMTPNSNTAAIIVGKNARHTWVERCTNSCKKRWQRQEVIQSRLECFALEVSVRSAG